jgi:hypothetical protein
LKTTNQIIYFFAEGTFKRHSQKTKDATQPAWPWWFNKLSSPFSFTCFGDWL